MEQGIYTLYMDIHKPIPKIGQPILLEVHLFISQVTVMGDWNNILGFQSTLFFSKDKTVV